MNKEYSNNFIKLFKPYSFRNWDKELFKISITYHEVKISPEELCLLLENPEKYEDRDLLKELPFFKDLEALIEKEYKGKSFFSKFFSRSAKDFGEVVYDCPYTLIEAFLTSLRVFEDMCVVRRADTNLDDIVIYLRPALEFDKKDEYRLFQVNGFTQVCSYHRNKNAEPIESELDKEFLDWNEKFVRPFTNLENYCIDFIRIKGVLTLIEINPWGLSDNILLDRKTLGAISNQIIYK